jgi:hypothetical protein
MSDAEREFAIREGERIGAWDAYSRARMGLGMIVHEASFCDGFDRGYLVRTREVTALQAEIEALRKDVERLEYLANDMQDMTFNGVEVLDFIEEDCDWPKAWRKAIDAAIAKEKQP